VTLDQVAGHLYETVAFLVVAEAGAGDPAHCHVTLRSGVAVATLQAEIDRSAGSERG
jgi:hypothetical protein